MLHALHFHVGIHKINLFLRIFEKRAEAESAIHLMRNTYERIRFEEESKDGLVIQTALFGRVLAGNDEPEVKEAEIIDVTVPLQ